MAGLGQNWRPFRGFADVLKAPVEPRRAANLASGCTAPGVSRPACRRRAGGCRVRKRGVVSERDTFERLLASLHKAALDPDLWPTTSALIDEAVAAQGNALLIAEGIERDAPMLFAAGYYRGERRPDLERDYLGNYHPWDERVVGLRRLPDSKLVHITELYSEQQLKTSRSYNEFSGRSGGQNSLNVRMDGPDGSNITWAILDPVKGRDWQSAQIQMIERLLPHIRQFVRVRQALANAKALGVSLTRLLDNMRLGVVAPRPARAHHRGERPRPRHSGAPRRVVRPGRFLARPCAGGRHRSPTTPGADAADLGQRGGRRLDAGSAAGRLAASDPPRRPRQFR